MPPPIPRLFVIRHGETEWSQNGRHTGRTDIPLTEHGVDLIRRRAPDIVGPGKLIDPDRIGFAFVSPRQRAHKTFHLLFENLEKPPPHEITEDVREWDYGDFEGLKAAEILEKQPGWSIWTDGCPNGESAEEMTIRVDKVIEKVRNIHRAYCDGDGKRDVMIIAHGHFSRVLLARWTEFPLLLGNHFNVEPAGIALLSYNHHTLEEPALSGLNLHAY